jgi:endonuclease/exonuclease/phosphatase (EEP) superfamily protein YafD
MGDFNATCNSEIYDAMAERGYRDAHRLAGTGRGTTWCNRGLFSLFPGFQIDHIFLSRELTAVSCETLSGPGSDHRALLAEIGFRSNPIHIND